MRDRGDILHGRPALVIGFGKLGSSIARLLHAKGVQVTVYDIDPVRRTQALSATTGWKAYDSGEQGLAQRYYLQSFALAQTSGVPGQDGFVMRTMSQQGMKLHRTEHCLALAETGWDRARGRVGRQVEVLFAVTHAHVLAKTARPGAPSPRARHARGREALSLN